MLTKSTSGTTEQVAVGDGNIAVVTFEIVVEPENAKAPVVQVIVITDQMARVTLVQWSTFLPTEYGVGGTTMPSVCPINHLAELLPRMQIFIPALFANLQSYLLAMGSTVNFATEMAMTGQVLLPML